MDMNGGLCWSAQYATTTASSNCLYSVSTAINNNNNKSMKESLKELYKLTFIKTQTSEVVFEVMAENPAQAKKLVEKGFSRCAKDEVIKVNIELFSFEDVDGEEVDEDEIENDCSCDEDDCEDCN